MPTQTRQPPACPPASERHHYVFLDPDGNPVGLVEAGHTGVNTEDAAWDYMYESRATERAARTAGIHCVNMSHTQYERDVCPLWNH